MNPLKYQEDEDPQLMLGSLTPGTSQQVAPTVPPPPPAPPPQALPPAPMKPMAVPPPVVAPKPTPRLPGMPPDVSPDDLEKYLGVHKASLNKYGPEERMALQNKIESDRNGLGNELTSGLKGFGDAVMMGVAGAGNPGWQQQYESDRARQEGQALEGMDKASEGNLKRTEATMSLDKMNPKSDLSKSAQQVYAPLFQKLGYQPDAIHGMSAANIESAMNMMSAYGGKEIEAQIKKYEMDIERQRTEGALANIQSEAENRKAPRDMEEKKLRIEHPILSALSHGTSNYSDTSSHPQAKEALQWVKDHPNDPRNAKILQRLGQ